ncbi:MAG: RnfABCDGE type electron transport complex subunit G [Gammaproteobacteria bacterium]
MTRVLLPLLVLTLICAGLIRATVEFTDTRIADNRQETVLRIIGDILPGPYNNEPLKETRDIIDAATFGSKQPVTVLTSRQGADIQGFVFMPVIAEGYNGPVKLAVGVNRNGVLSGVRVLEQGETEGLGDAVDQYNSDWIEHFQNRSLDNTPPVLWTVRRDGGDFDQLSGATITSRGVIQSVRKVLEYYHQNKQRFLEREKLNAE